jgi:signal transduction histidine kinase
MKLLNHTTKYFSIALLIIVSIWAVVFYLNMLDEVYDSLDDGLDNYKMLIIEKAQKDTTVLYKTEFEESNYSIRELPRAVALTMRDNYRDTLMYMVNEEDYEPVRILTTAFDRKGKYYQLNIISSMVEEDDLITDLLSAIVVLYFAMMLSILVFNNLLLKRIWKPFYYLIDQLKGFRLGIDKTVQMKASAVEEFNLLNDAMGSMVQRALETYHSQREFIENASHELQTPLAISINKLELLAERGTLTENDMITVGSVIQALERITRLNKSLLLLTKIENRQFQDNSPININKAIRSIVTEFNDFAAFREVRVFINERGILEKNMNSDLAEILISNLVRNAIVHNVANGTVNIEVDTRELTVINTGNNKALDDALIFNRFYKESDERQTTGLGLSIVKAICSLYDLDVSYYYNNAHILKVKF